MNFPKTQISFLTLFRNLEFYTGRWSLYAKLDTLQESIDRLADALTPADAETDAEAPTEEQPAPDYTAQLSGISAQLADMAQQATAETAEDADPFQKPFEEYTTGETLSSTTSAHSGISETKQQLP